MTQTPGSISPASCLCGWPPPENGLWPTQGPLAVRWIEENLIFAEGDWYGKPFKLRPDQKLFLYRWYEYCGGCQQWRYDEGLRGAATGDGKTALIAAIACLEFAGPPQIAPPSPNIPVAAASYEQADLLFSAASVMLGGTGNRVTEAPLCGLFEVYEREIKFAGGKPGRMYKVAAVAGTNEGGIPTLFICDELHEWGDPGSGKARVHTVIGKSTRKRNTPRGPGRILNLSTAGFDVDRSLLGQMYQRGRRALADPTVAPRFLFDWQEAPDGLNYSDPADRAVAVRAASAAADVLWSVQARVDDYDRPSFPKHEWLRYYANRWVDVADDSWLTDHPSAWKDCQGLVDPDDSNPYVIAVDMALGQDTCAVVRCERIEDGRTAVLPKIWRPEDYGGRVSFSDVFEYIRATAKGGGFRGVVYDPRYFQLMAENLEAQNIEVVEFDQQPARMTPACGHAYELIVNKQIVHPGDPDFSAHVTSAVKHETDRGFTLRKSKSKRRIDGAVALAMGCWVLEQVAEDDNEPGVWIL